MGRLDHVFRVRLSGDLRGAVLQEAERQGVTVSQLTRAALVGVVGTKGGADRDAAAAAIEREKGSGNGTAAQVATA